MPSTTISAFPVRASVTSAHSWGGVRARLPTVASADVGGHLFDSFVALSPRGRRGSVRAETVWLLALFCAFLFHKQRGRRVGADGGVARRRRLGFVMAVRASAARASTGSTGAATRSCVGDAVYGAIWLRSSAVGRFRAFALAGSSYFPRAGRGQVHTRCTRAAGGGVYRVAFCRTPQKCPPTRPSRCFWPSFTLPRQATPCAPKRSDGMGAPKACWRPCISAWRTRGTRFPPAAASGGGRTGGALEVPATGKAARCIPYGDGARGALYGAHRTDAVYGYYWATGC
jgi:hypothetical protein